MPNTVIINVIFFKKSEEDVNLERQNDKEGGLSEERFKLLITFLIYLSCLASGYTYKVIIESSR